MGYYLYEVYSKYKVTPVPLYMSTILGSIYFLFSCWTQYNRLRTLYDVCRENQKLTDEIKQLLQIFPECVIIRSGLSTESTKRSYTNQEFRNHICDVRKKLDDIKEVSVSFIQEDEKNSSCTRIKTSLSKLLKQQEKICTEKTITEKNNVKISCYKNSPPLSEGVDSTKVNST